MIKNRTFEAQILSFNGMATEGRGVTQQTFIQGGSARKSNPLPFYIPFFHEKGAPLSYTFLSTNGISFNCCKCIVI